MYDYNGFGKQVKKLRRERNIAQEGLTLNTYIPTIQEIYTLGFPSFCGRRTLHDSYFPRNRHGHF